MRKPITKKGAEQLKAELKRLKNVERPKIIEAVATARDHGDLKENAEYHAAREQQSFNEGRIGELESLLGHAEIIDVSNLNVGDKVVFGATVVLEDEDTGDHVTYQIVGDAEANIDEGKISISSPIARALVGKSVDDEVHVQAPGGEKTYFIEDIQYI
ncbi:transcription elongation factor GreA [Marinicella gelatinilytica]|uniref:transcription elongation factor GreA n=1 Tax=Marinicella gelatinilytica TaxID=2996017 RepID=UPI002260967D|nr:transcription elongation factor GreA [Marinicella gelatinilytica]MCX7545442.1 transcription elongation factor GreA [Marinicella gelatinilytica]